MARFAWATLCFNLAVFFLHSNGIYLQLLIAVFTRPQIQRERCQFVDDWNRQASFCEIDTLQVCVACIADIDADMWNFRC